MSFFNKKPDEFYSEMPANDEYDDEEYYGEEEGEYASDEEYEEDYDEEDEGGAAAPKKNVVKTAIFGVIAVAAIGLGGFYAMNFFAPEMTQELVNQLPFVSKGEGDPAAGDQFTDVPGGTATPAADGEVAPPPEDVTASADVAAVPAAPPKPQPVKPTPKAPAVKKPTPKPVAPKPAKVAVAPVAKPAPKKWTPKPAAARKWQPRTAWKPRTQRYARYYAPQTRYSRYRAAKTYYGRAGAAAYARRYPTYRRAARTTPAYNRRYAAAPRAGGRYTVQVGSFANTANAQALVSQLRAQGVNAYMSGGGSNGSAGHLVRSVGVRNRANANRLLTQYRAAGYPARIVPVGNGLVAVSAGVYSTPERAQAVVSTLNQRGLYATHGYTAAAPRSGGMARVYIGSYGSRTAAATRMRQLQQQGIPAAVTTTR